MKDVLSQQVFIGSLLCTLMFSQNVIANEKRTFSSSVGTQVTYDDNLYRINKDSDLIQLLLGDFDYSDTITSTFANVDIDWDISQQNILANALVNKNKFSKNSQFDNTSTLYELRWNWFASSMFTGTVSYKSRTQLANFTDNLNAALLASKVENDVSAISVNWKLLRYWELQLGMSENTTKYSVEALSFNNKRIVRPTVMLRYRSESKNSLSLSLYQGNIEYENREFVTGNTIDNEYQLSTIVLATEYYLSDKSHLSARLIWRELDPENLSNKRDFDLSDWGFNFRYRWFVSAATQLTFSLADEVAPSENVNTDFQRSQLARINVTWKTTNKVYLTLTSEYIKRQYEYNENTNPNSNFASDNTYKKSGLSLLYFPTDLFELKIGYEFNNQRSNLLSRNYDYNTTFASIVVNF